MRLYTKVIYLVTFVVMSVGISSSVLVSQVMRGAMEEDLEEKAVIIAQTLAEPVTRDVVNGNRISVRDTVHEIVRRTPDVDYAFIVGFDHEIFAHSFEGGFPRALMHKAQDVPCMDAPRRDRYQHLTSERAFIDVSYPLVDGMAAHVHVGMNESRLERHVAVLRNRIFGLTFGTVVLAIGLGLLISHQVTRPISELAGSMRAFGKGESGQEIHFRSGGSEVADLTRSFNRMITQREQAEEALRESEEKFRQIAEAVREVFWVGSPDWSEVHYVSPAYEDVWGRSCQSLYDEPRSWLDAVHADDRECVLAAIERKASAALCDPEFPEYRVVRPDGSVRWILARSYPVHDENSQVVRIVGIAEDITGRKRAVEALNRQKEELQIILDSVPAMIFFKDKDNRFIRINRALANTSHLPKDQIEGKTAFEVYPDYAEEYWRDDMKVIDSGKPKRNIVEPMVVGQETKWVQTDKLPYRDSADNIIGIIGFAQDITERKRAEEALQESEERFRNLFNGISDGVAVYEAVDNGADFVFLDYNPAGEKMDVASKEDVVGRRVTEVFPGVETLGLLDAMRRVWKSGISEDCPVSAYEDERVTFWRKNSVHKLPSGEIVAVYSDQTARKQAEQERENLIAELEAKNAELERFTYTVSHDLRSPLVTITGFLGMLRRDVEAGNAEAMEEDMTFISNAAHKMKQLLDELLDLSRIGRQDNPPVEIALADLAQEVVSMTSEKLAGRGIQVDISPDLPVVFGDRLRLWEVLQNLVDNAEKFMGDQPDPRIEIGSRRDADETVCYVRDNGMGIDPAYHEKVFGLFDRLDPNSEGVGVGLAIVKRIVDIHGGRIWVESGGPGQGATFCFTIPRKREETNHERD